jgi:hypothetical protein
VNTILTEDFKSIDLVDLGRIGNFGLWDKICERLIGFDGDVCIGWSPTADLPDSHDILRFSVPSGEFRGPISSHIELSGLN